MGQSASLDLRRLPMGLPLRRGYHPRPMMPRLVLFDIDGTLLSCRGSGRRSLDHALEERFGRKGLCQDIVFQGRMDPDIVDEIIANAGGEPGDRQWVLDRYLAILAEEIVDCPPRVLPGVRDVLRELRGAESVTVALVTGNLREGAKLKLGSVGLWDEFQFGCFAEDAHTRGELVSIARQRAEDLTGIAFGRESCFLVGDTVNDVKAAHHGGAVSVAVATGGQSMEQLAAHEPALLLESLDPAELFLGVVLP